MSVISKLANSHHIMGVLQEQEKIFPLPIPFANKNQFSEKGGDSTKDDDSKIQQYATITILLDPKDKKGETMRRESSSLGVDYWKTG